MANQILIDGIAQTDLILLVDAGLGGSDPERLPPGLLQLVVDRNTAGRQINSGLAMAGGDERGASLLVANSIGRLGGLLRNGHSALGAIPEEDVDAADLLDAMETYGWAQGNLGDLDKNSRVLDLARLALVVTPQLPVAVRYPANVITRLTNWLGVYDANKLIAGGGLLQVLVDQQETIMGDLGDVISRVRHYLCSTSDRTEYLPSLALRGYQVKRPPGEAQPQPFPGDPGPATLNEATRELSIAGMPEHGTSIVAYRKPAGGQEEQAGVSVTPVVGISSFSPLTPGVSYTVSLAGRNSRGFGPRSNEITFTA